MRTSITVFFVALLTLSSGLGFSQGKSDLAIDNIRGQVKQITETGIYVKEGARVINHIQITQYDRKGKELGYTFASKYDDLQPTKTIYEFDKQGNRVVEKRYDLAGNVENTLTYFYDSAGNVIEDRFFTSFGTIDTYSYTTYNLYGDRIEYKSFYSDSSLWLWHKFIYKERDLIEILDLRDSSLYKYTHDQQQNIIKYVECDKFGKEIKVSTYVYEYDHNLNWTKKTLYENGELYWIDERRLEYYPK